MENFFVYNGKSSRDFGVWISGGGTFNAPAREVSEVIIPGRNGVLTLDNGRYEAIDMVYPAFISKRFKERVDAFRAFLLTDTGIHRLEDTYHPDEFRLARYTGGFNVSPIVRNLGGNFEVAFRCQPQRYLKAGEIAKEFTEGGVLFNYTLYPARPLITVYGASGTLTINGTALSLSDIDTSATIDCEAMEVPGYNDKTVLLNGEFPVLDPGENTIAFTGFDKIEVTPRWWTL